MRRFHKLLSLLLALAIVTGVTAAFPMTAGASSDENLPYSVCGTCGAENPEDIEWYAFNDNSMVLFGTGAIQDYTLSNGVSTAPWYGHDYSTISSTLFATKIAVEYGITRIGDYCFYIGDNYPYNFIVQLQNIDIANTVTSIGKYAFYNQKIQQIILPPSVTHIGANAFKKCTLNKLSYYGDPDDLVWESDGEDSEFPSGITCHILTKYADHVSAYNARFAYKHITFTADLEDMYAGAGEDVDRNIALYYGTANIRVFGGAAPYIIVGRFDGKKKSVTHGSNGFASCVLRDNKYYILTQNSIGALNEATVNGTSGKVEGYNSTALSDLKLRITHEYIGTNTVKVIYTLQNTSNAAITGLKVGGTGDIKIGADDFAAIEPLSEGGSQVGFYMKSNQNFDKSGDNYATLGFIGSGVEKTKAEGGTPATYYDNAHYFYGKADSNKGGSAVGSKTVVMIPERIFNMNTADNANSGRSQDSGSFDYGLDSGMSYYWDNIDLAANESKQYAVLFSVYGASNDASAQTVIEDIKDTYYTATFQNTDHSVLYRQVVKNGDSPVYGGVTPTKARHLSENYTFSGWTDGTDTYAANAELPEVTGDVTYTATYDVGTNKLFHEHSITLHGDIGVNFFLNVTHEEVERGVTVKFHWQDNEGKVNRNSEYTLSPDDYDSGTGHYKAKCWVPAAEMTYSIHAVAWFEGNEYTGETDDYCVKDYGAEVLNPDSDFSKSYGVSQPTEYAKLRDLMICMLDYGAKAQLAFDRKTGDLANNIFSTYGVTYSMETLTAEQIGEYTEANTPMKTSGSSVGLKFSGSSVVYLSKTSIRHYYTVTDSSLFTEEVINADHGGFTYHTKDHGLYFELSDIPASKLDEPQVFRLGGEDYSFSALNYSQMVLDSSLPQADKDLAIATVWYNQAAKRYFGD